MNFVINTLSFFENYVFSFKGFRLGLSTFLVGIFLDNTVSINSKNKLIETKKKLLNDAYIAVSTNLLVLSPIFYNLVDKVLITNKTTEIELIKYFTTLGIHSIGYYYSHNAMHNINILKPIHKFHHKFNDVLIPSIGNAVSPAEFTLAYVSPFLISSYVLNTNLPTLNLSIQTISLFNLFIHCHELKNIPYHKYLVSPSDHIQHHKYSKKKETYAAPIINIDQIIREF